MIPIPYVHLGIGCLMVVLSVPLVFRMIPMNHFYGVRTRRAFVSDSNWYAINAYGGKWLLVSGIALVAFGYFGRRFAPAPTSAWAPVYFVVALLLLAPAIVAIVAFDRRLPDR